MKNFVLNLAVVALSIAFVGCKRDCDNIRPGTYVPFTPAFEAWMTDSAKQSFEMTDADSTVIPWHYDVPRYGGGLTSWYECTEEPLRRHEIQEKSYSYTAPSTGETVRIALHTCDGIAYVIVEFNDALVHYIPSIQEFATTETAEGKIRPRGEILSSYPLRSKLWQEVLMIDTQASFVTYPKIWLAKGWGIIRYENQAGKAWERLP